MWIDIAVVALLAAFTLYGYLRGLFSQAWSIFSLIGSFFGAGPALALIRDTMGLGPDDSWLGEWVMRLLVGLGLYVLLLAFGYLIEKKFLEKVRVLSFGNRFLGVVFGLVKGGILAVVILWIAIFIGPALAGAKSGSPLPFGSTNPFPADAKQSIVLTQLSTSKVAGVIAPYNPLNLLLLARLRPYLPQEATGGSRTPVKAPKTLTSRETFRTLIADKEFIQAYRERRYFQVLTNASFHRFVQDAALIEALRAI